MKPYIYIYIHTCICLHIHTHLCWFEVNLPVWAVWVRPRSGGCFGIGGALASDRHGQLEIHLEGLATHREVDAHTHTCVSLNAYIYTYLYLCRYVYVHMSVIYTYIHISLSLSRYVCV